MSLSEDLKRSGLREKIWLFEGQILDGRNRYRACIRADVMPQFRQFTGSRQQALDAVISWNLERRHLTASQKAAVAAELDGLIATLTKEARQRQLEQSSRGAVYGVAGAAYGVAGAAYGARGGRGNKKDTQTAVLFDQPVSTKLPSKENPPLVAILPQGGGFDHGVQTSSQNSQPKPVAPKTRDRVASAMGVSPRYVSDAKKLKDQSPELHQAVKDGHIAISTAMQAAALPAQDIQTVVEALKNAPAVADADKPAKQKLAKQVIQDVKVQATKAQLAEQVQEKPRLWLSDAVDWLTQQSGYDLLLTDPPYSTDVADVVGFAKAWLPLALSKLSSKGRAYVCIGAYPEELYAYMSVAMPSQVLVWTYRNTLGPTPKGKYKQNWQAILYYQGKDAPDLDCPQMTEQFSVQDINAPDGRQADRFHEWQKPIELANRFIRHSTKPGDIVADPFACTGTFVISASKLGRIGIGCDNCLANLRIAEDLGCQVFE